MLDYLKRRLDVVGLFGLGVIALAGGGLKTLGLHPFAPTLAGRLPTTRRRVVLFIPSLGLGGAQRQLVAFLKHLDRTRWDPELVTLDIPDKFFEPAVRTMAVPITYLNSQRDFWMVAVLWRLFRHLCARPCHVLHNWMHYAVAFGAIAGGMAGIPTIIGSLRSQRTSRMPWSNSRWQRALDVLTGPLHTWVIANSNAVREDNRCLGTIPGKLRTIYNGIDTEEITMLDDVQQGRLRSELNLPGDVPVVGIVGRLYPEKDHATFLRAAALINRTRPDIRFLIVGDGRLRQWIEEEIQRLGLAARVHMLGERRDAQAIIQLLDVLVMTSVSEGFPNVLLEAAFARTPVVATAVGGVPEAILDGETGVLVPCGDAEAVARSVVTLLDDPVLSKQLAAAAWERARRLFSAGQAAAAMQTYYASGDAFRAGRCQPERPLRVCFISTYAYGLLKPSSKLPFGGAEVQICSLVRELSCDPRFEISILTGDGDREGREQDGRVTIVLHPFIGTHQDPGMCPLPGEQSRLLDSWPAGAAAVLRAGRKRAVSWPPLRWLAQRIRDGQAVIKWGRMFRSIGADIYVARCAWVQNGYMQRACSFLRRKFVYMVASDMDVSGDYARSLDAYGERYESGLQHADAIVCQHADQVRVVQSRYRRDAHLIRSFSPFPVRPPAGVPRKTVLWIARVDSGKQPDLFVDLASCMQDQSFVLVGPPSQNEPGNLPRLLERVKGIPNLRILQGVPFKDTLALFAEAMVFVSTSLGEGFPNTFLQAAACGTPIVSWAVNPEEVLHRYQFGFCANKDWARFEQFVRLVCMDTTLRMKLGENGRRYVREHHDPAAIAGEYAELFWHLRSGTEAASMSTSPAGRESAPVQRAS